MSVVTRRYHNLALFLRLKWLRVPPRRKLGLEKIRAALNETCPLCSAELPPNQQVRIDFEHMQCGKCGQTFRPKSGMCESTMQ